MRILIAEDERRAMRGLKNLITSISDQYEVVAEAANGRQALELIQIVKPDVVFTDLKMPYMDGMSLIKASQAAGVTTQYVIVTAYEEFEAAREAIVLGVKDYLVKPITYDEVYDLMKRLEKKKGERTSEEIVRLKEKYPDVHPLVIKCLNFIEKDMGQRSIRKNLQKIWGFLKNTCAIFLIKKWE